MSAIDHATVQLPSAAPRPRRRPRRVTPARAAIAFAAAQVPLFGIAVAFEWRDSWEAPEKHGPLVTDLLQHGSAISGPLMPQLIFLVLAFAASRRDRRVSLIGTAAIAVMGVLVTFNGVMGALNDAEHTPQAVASAGGIGFALAGLTLLGLSVRELARR